VAFCRACAARFNVSDRADEGDVLEYGHRVVRAKKYPGRKQADGTVKRRPGSYFAFAKNAGSVVAAAMTPTHRMMQAIICDVRFVQCSILGTIFNADLLDPVAERTRPGDIAAGRGQRRPDITASCERASVLVLNAGPLDIEVAVTNPVKDFARYLDLIKAGRPCLEILVPRDVALESDPEALDEQLRKDLAAASLVARWIVDPSGAKASPVALQALKDRLNSAKSESLKQIADSEATIEQTQKKRDGMRGVQASGEDQQRTFDQIERETVKLVELAHQLDETSRPKKRLVDIILEVVIPALRDGRLKTQAEKARHILKEMNAAQYRRSGLQSSVQSLLRTNARVEKASAERAQVESQLSALETRAVEQRRTLSVVEFALLQVADLLAAGLTDILRPPGYTVREILQFEHRRWC
jgi:hypothetical protein